MVNLLELKIGQEAEILEFLDSSIKNNSQRFGMFEGGKVVCVAKPGPVILKISQQLIAVGKDLSKKIYVKVCEN